MDTQKNNKWINVLLSHTLVALLAAVAATLLVLGLVKEEPKVPTKLEILEQLILNNYVGEADQILMEDIAAYAMISTLGDQWSYYVSAEQSAEYQEGKQNAYIGVGISISQRQDGIGLDVAEVKKGGPADEAGILPGDVIVGVGDQRVAGMEMDDIHSLLQGEEGTVVEITVLREEKEHTYTLTRKQIETPAATGVMVAEDVGLVRIANFYSRSSEETIAAVEELMKQGAKKIIFDVRYNRGGSASQLDAVLDYLLPEVRMYGMEDRLGNKTEVTSDAQCLQIPMVVLVNGSTYSAAELFAAALRENDAALLVGEKTVGKGYYQYTYILPDGSVVGLSVGKYYTPKGNHLEGIGLTPDKVVPVDEKMAAAIKAGILAPEDDYQIQAAIATLGEK